MISTKEIFSIHRKFIVLMCVALVAGAGFFVTNNLDFLISAITYGKASLPNVAYWLSKCVGTILIPAVFIVPSIPHLDRIKAAKYSFMLYGLTFILSSSWIVMYIMSYGFNGLFLNENIMAYQAASENSFIGSYVYWNDISWFGNILNIVFGAFCIYVGFNMDDDKRKVCTLITILIAFRLIMPIVANLVAGNGFLSTAWITNNFVDIISLGALTAALFLAAKYDDTWILLVWDQEIPQTDEEDA